MAVRCELCKFSAGECNKNVERVGNLFCADMSCLDLGEVRT
jgi:hypothetical protein